MPIIVNNLETQEDIEKYQKWLSEKKSLRSIISIKKMLEVDKKHRPDKWKNIDLRIELLEREIKKRKN